MATKEEWREYFELTEGRNPTLAKFQAALKNGEIDEAAPVQPEIVGNPAPKKKSKKWIWFVAAVVIVLGIGGGVFGWTQYQKSQAINATNIVNYLKSHGYKEVTGNGFGLEYSTFYINKKSETARINDSDDSTSELHISQTIETVGKIGKKGEYGTNFIEMKSGTYPTGKETNLTYATVPANGDVWLEVKFGSTGGRTFTVLSSLSQIPAAE